VTIKKPRCVATAGLFGLTASCRSGLLARGLRVRRRRRRPFARLGSRREGCRLAYHRLCWRRFLRRSRGRRRRSDRTVEIERAGLRRPRCVEVSRRSRSRSRSWRRRCAYLRGHRFARRVDHRARRRRLERGEFYASRLLVVATAIVGIGGTFVEASFAGNARRGAGGAKSFGTAFAAPATTTATTATRSATGALTAIALGSLLLTVAQSR